MKVKIVTATFNSATHFESLDRILDHFLSGRHLWAIDDVDAIKQSMWLSTNDRVTRRNLEVLEKCFVAAATAGATLMHGIALDIDVKSVAPLQLTPDEALEYLSQPAVVIVENEQSDGAFLAATTGAFERTDVWFAFENRWIELDHAGGYGEVEKRIERYVERTKGPYRVMVLADSDRMHVGHQSQTETHIRDVCTRHGVPFAILTKRTIENYLPVGALQRSTRRDCYQAFLRLSTEQRDHYNMKKGFARDDRGNPSVPAEQQQLFAHVPPRVLIDLIGGFGKEAWKLFVDARDVMSADALRLTCLAQPQELPDLFDQIEGLI